MQSPMTQMQQQDPSSQMNNNMVASGQLGNSQLAPSSNQNKLVQLNSGQFEDYLVQALNDSLMKKSK